jgi:hypothetical protein
MKTGIRFHDYVGADVIAFFSQEWSVLHYYLKQNIHPGETGTTHTFTLWQAAFVWPPPPLPT